MALSKGALQGITKGHNLRLSSDFQEIGQNVQRGDCLLRFGRLFQKQRVGVFALLVDIFYVICQIIIDFGVGFQLLLAEIVILLIEGLTSHG